MSRGLAQSGASFESAIGLTIVGEECQSAERRMGFVENSQFESAGEGYIGAFIST